uniref:Agenet domain-containing protein n=1 Tax=Quercus lobata TaxID=97700 RepID=A0A7N2LXR1_QUELO
MSDSETPFRKGDQVEVTKPHHHSYATTTSVATNGPYYPAIVLRSHPTKDHHLLIQYQTLKSLHSGPYGPQLLTEYVHWARVRPIPPNDPHQGLKVGDSVDAFRGCSWVKGTVMDIYENSKYLVLFDEEEQELEIEQWNLRLHRNWVRGSWDAPLLELLQEKPSETEVESRNCRIMITYSRRKSKEKFRKGTMVEVSSDEEGYKGSWFTATVIQSTGSDKFLLEYHNLTMDDGTQPLREEVHAQYIRPFPPEVPGVVSFKELQEVDAWYNEGWWEGVISKVLNFSEYIVYFSYSNEELRFGHSKLRPHQHWINGKWVIASKLEVQEKPSEMEMESRDLRIKITYSSKKSTEKFRKGTLVEVSSDEEGYKGSWFTATVIGSTGSDRFLVEYHNLTMDDGIQPFREEAHARHIRPFPPKVSGIVHFKKLQEVDAWYNDGWWEGVISKVINFSEYIVYFSSTNEELRFEHSKLRPHQHWINGTWLIASKGKSCELAMAYRDVQVSMNDAGNKSKAKFNLGAMVEVRSDEEGFRGSWYTAIIVDLIGNDKFLVEYQTLRTEDETELLREEADVSDIRPCPPDIEHLYRFAVQEKVDVWYNEGWWVGYISNVLDDLRYRVYFETTNEVLEFEHSDLRPHQEWVDGNWVAASRVGHQ